MSVRLRSSKRAQVTALSPGEKRVAADNSIDHTARLEMLEESSIERGLAAIAGRPPSTEDMNSLIAAAKINAFPTQILFQLFLCGKGFVGAKLVFPWQLHSSW